jgi:hypothetical protein
VGTPTLTVTPPGPATWRQLCVLAFDDADGDGARQLDERLLPGVTLRLTHGPSGAFVTWTTDGANDPDHCWAGLADGNYTLKPVEMPRGFVATGLVERTFNVPFTVSSVQYEFGAYDTTRPTPTVPPTPIPTPSATQTAPATPTSAGSSTAPPSPTVRPTTTPQPTVDGPNGQVCVGVYRDGDASGFREGVEPYLADHRVSIAADGGVEVRALQSLATEPVCSRLAPGVYHVAVQPVPGWEPTTVQEQAILLTSDDHILLEFGRHRRGGAVYLPFAAASPGGGPAARNVAPAIGSGPNGGPTNARRPAQRSTL